MNKKVFFSLICIFHFISAYTQSLSNNEIYLLQAIISNFVAEKDNRPNAKTERSSELMFCLLQVDSTGRINSIDIFADDKNKDSTYSYLSRMSPLVLKDWKSEKCKGKTLLMPVVSISYGKIPDYMNNLIDERFIKPLAVMGEINKLVVITPLQYGTPVTEKEMFPEKDKRIDKIKKNN